MFGDAANVSAWTKAKANRTKMSVVARKMVTSATGCRVAGDDRRIIGIPPCVFAMALATMKEKQHLCFFARSEEEVRGRGGLEGRE